MSKIYLFAIISLVSTGLALVEGKEVCYGDLGCFRDTYPFSGTTGRPIAFLPESPQKVGTKFRLFNKNRLGGEQISADFLGKAYDSQFSTKFIVHGFIHNGKKDWVLEMKDALMAAHNNELNVIAVDWSQGNGLPYTQATANTQIVGAEIAKLVKFLVKERGAEPEQFHIIGHSLGAHVGGYAGERIIGLGRITGLDPAGPYFENTEKRVRLDPTDALYVDVVHSDGSATVQLGLGLFEPVGHVDYYPNGGKDQPGCPKTSGKILGAVFNGAALDVAGLEDTLACSHMAAVYFFTDSIKNECTYKSYPCKTSADFEAGECLTCSAQTCNRLGYWSSPRSANGTFYLRTESPLNGQLCKHTYAVTLTSNKLPSLLQTRGKFGIYVQESAESGGWTSPVTVLDEAEVTFKPESVEKRVMALSAPRPAIDSVHVSFTKTSSLIAGWMYDDQWSFRSVELFDGESQKAQLFCPTKSIIKSGETVRFNKC